MMMRLTRVREKSEEPDKNSQQQQEDKPHGVNDAVSEKSDLNKCLLLRIQEQMSFPLLSVF